MRTDRAIAVGYRHESIEPMAHLNSRLSRRVGLRSPPSCDGCWWILPNRMRTCVAGLVLGAFVAAGAPPEVNVIPPTPPVGKNEHRSEPVMLRPSELIPGRIPAEVRYKFASDEEMMTAREIVIRMLSGPASASSTADNVFVCAGAWSLFRKELAPLASPDIRQQSVKFGPNVYLLDAGLLQRSEARKKLVALLKKSLNDGTNVRIRAMSTHDMQYWWPFIGFDLEEPVLALDSSSTGRVFIVCMKHERITVVDDLPALSAVMNHTTSTNRRGSGQKHR